MQLKILAIHIKDQMILTRLGISYKSWVLGLYFDSN